MSREMTLHLRHDDPCRVIEDLVSLVDPVLGRVGPPILQSVEYRIGTHGDVQGMPRVTVEWDGLSTNLEVIAWLAEPIAGRTTQRVHVLCMGLCRKTKVSDADTGEDIPVMGVRVQMVAGNAVMAWVDPWFQPTQDVAA